MAQTKLTLTETYQVLFGASLDEPEHIEHNGGLYSVKLQNTFQDKRGCIVAVWVIDQFLRPARET